MSPALRTTPTTGWPLMHRHAIVVRQLLPEDADPVVAVLRLIALRVRDRAAQDGASHEENDL
jgi:hypothetical protein